MYQIFTYIYLLLFCFIAMAILLFFSFKYRENKGVKEFIFMMLLFEHWFICQGLELMALNLHTKLFWANMLYISAALVPVANLLAAMHFSGKDKLITKKNLTLLTIIYSIIFFMIFTDHYFGLMRTNFSLDTSAIPYVIKKDYSIIYPFYLFLSYGLNVLSIMLLFPGSRKRYYAYQRQCIAVISGIVITVTANMLYILKVFGSFRYDITPPFFVIASIIYYMAIRKYKVFALTPTGRNVLIENMPNGVLILDRDNLVVDINQFIEKHFNLSKRKIIGKKIEIENPLFGSIKKYKEMGIMKFSIDEKIFNIESYVLDNKKGEYLGDVYLINDITEAERNLANIIEKERIIGVMKEREKIGRDLHDEIGQIFGYYHIKAQTVHNYFEDKDYEKVKEQLQQLISISNKGQVEVRSYITNMRSKKKLNIAFTATLKQYIHEFAMETGNETDLNFDDALPENFPDENIASELLKIIGEALNNIRKHAGKCKVWIRFECNNNYINVSIKDNGNGFNINEKTEKGHYGLNIMKERADEIGAVFKILSEIGKETIIEVRIER